MARGNGTGEALFSISQVNALTGVPKSTIRFWEKEFGDYLAPLRSIGGQRRYTRETVERIEKINRLVNQEGYTLEGARRRLEPEPSAATVVRESDSDTPVSINDLAVTMSDYLLQKLFERIRAEEAHRINPAG